MDEESKLKNKEIDKERKKDYRNHLDEESKLKVQEIDKLRKEINTNNLDDLDIHNNNKKVNKN